MEIFVPVIGFEGFYEVSNHGRVKSVARTVVDKNGSPKPLRERFLTLHKYKLSKRYPRPHLHVELWKNNVRSVPLVHRLVAFHFVPNPSGKPHINHIDGNPSNNHADNLEWVTASENNLHAYRTGLKKPTGQKPIRGTNLITGETILFDNLTQAAKHFNVTIGAIGAPLKGYGRSKNGCGYKWEYQ